MKHPQNATAVQKNEINEATKDTGKQEEQLHLSLCALMGDVHF